MEASLRAANALLFTSGWWKQNLSQLLHEASYKHWGTSGSIVPQPLKHTHTGRECLQSFILIGFLLHFQVETWLWLISKAKWICSRLAFKLLKMARFCPAVAAHFYAFPLTITGEKSLSEVNSRNTYISTHIHFFEASLAVLCRTFSPQRDVPCNCCLLTHSPASTIRFVVWSMVLTFLRHPGFWFH